MSTGLHLQLTNGLSCTHNAYVRTHALATCLLVLLILATAYAPAFAWLYDAGPTQHLGADLSNGAWIAAPFTVPSDCYATTFGAAVARGMGPTGAGYDVYLTTTFAGLPATAIAKLPLPLVPLTTQWVYYDGALPEPVSLRKGVAYALVLIPNTPNLVGSISWGTKPGTYRSWRSTDGGLNWAEQTWPVCVRIDGYYVPEPDSAMALAWGLGLLGSLMPLLRRRCEPRG